MGRRSYAVACGVVILGWGCPSIAADLSLQSAQSRLNLPESIAHVTDDHWTAARKSPEFILVQDVHKHPEVQSHIARIILEGYHRWGASKVFVEGAFSDVDVSVFENVTGPARQMLLRRLLQQGDLSGPELAAILIQDETGGQPSEFQLVGMEDPAIYRDNLEAYEIVQKQRDEAVKTLYATSAFDFRPDERNRLLLLLQLKMTPTDYAAYWQERRRYPSTPQILRYSRAAEHFYELVHIRSHIFLDRARRRLPAWTGPRMVVVGGFHTALMAEELRREGRSFVVLTPTVTQSGYEPLYQKHLMDNVSALLPPKSSYSQH